MSTIPILATGSHSWKSTAFLIKIIGKFGKPNEIFAVELEKKSVDKINQISTKFDFSRPEEISRLKSTLIKSGFKEEDAGELQYAVAAIRARQKGMRVIGIDVAIASLNKSSLIFRSIRRKKDRALFSDFRDHVSMFSHVVHSWRDRIMVKKLKQVEGNLGIIAVGAMHGSAIKKTLRVRSISALPWSHKLLMVPAQLYKIHDTLLDLKRKIRRRRLRK